MWWECSECGDHVERARAPLQCRECGIAGIIFVAAGVDEPMAADPETDSLRAMWLRVGFEQSRPKWLEQPEV